MACLFATGKAHLNVQEKTDGKSAIFADVVKTNMQLLMALFLRR
jgi:hypothetical protein